MPQFSAQDWQKLGLSKPTGTDYEEHSAVGDVSTGRRFKAVQNVPCYVLIDASVPNVTYIGESKPGTVTSSPLWRIKVALISVLASGTYSAIKFADGDDLFDNVWDSHASLSYS